MAGPETGPAGAGIAEDARAWATELRHGGPRSARLSAGNVGYTVLVRLPGDVLTRAAQTCTTAAHRLVLALAAIRAARPIALQRLMLDDVDRQKSHGRPRRGGSHRLHRL